MNGIAKLLKCLIIHIDCFTNLGFWCYSLHKIWTSPKFNRRDDMRTETWTYDFCYVTTTSHWAGMLPREKCLNLICFLKISHTNDGYFFFGGTNINTKHQIHTINIQNTKHRKQKRQFKKKHKVTNTRKTHRHTRIWYENTQKITLFLFQKNKYFQLFHIFFVIYFFFN